MQETTILLDCDDILLDWIGGFIKFASSNLGYEIVGKPNGWDMSSWLGVPDIRASKLINEFNNSDAFGQLESVENAYDVLRELYSDGAKMHVITSCSTDQKTTYLRRCNLEHQFGPMFESIHCLELGQSKLNTLQAWSQGAIWVEDNYNNALLGLEAGHRSIIRSRPHNIAHRDNSHPDLEWFDDWDELLTLIGDHNG